MRRRHGRLAAPALAVLLLLAPGCSLFRRGEDGDARRARFRHVAAPVAFTMMHDSPEMPVIDLRPEEDFHGPLGHIRGALNFPLRDIEAGRVEISFLRGQTFVVYCREHECDPEALEVLDRRGMEDAILLYGGIEAWLDHGFGTVGAGGPADHDDGPG